MRAGADGSRVQRLREITYAQAGRLPPKCMPSGTSFRKAGSWLLTTLLAEGHLADLDIASADDFADYLIWPRTIWKTPGHCLFDLEVRPRLRLTYFGLLVFRMLRASGYTYEEAVDRINEDYGGFV